MVRANVRAVEYQVTDAAGRVAGSWIAVARQPMLGWFCASRKELCARLVGDSSDNRASCPRNRIVNHKTKNEL